MNPDGSVTISTELDPSGAEKGMASLGRSLGYAAAGLAAAWGALSVAAANVGAGFREALLPMQARTRMADEAVQALALNLRGMARDGSHSATEIAHALSKVAVYGMDADEAYRLMRHSMTLANATGAELGASAQFLSLALMKTGADTSKAARYIDAFAKAAALSGMPPGKLQKAVVALAPTMNATGMSIEEASGALAQLYRGGLYGVGAARGIEQMFAALSGTASDAATEAVAALGVSMFDARGEMRPFNGALLETMDAIQGLSTEQERAAATAGIFRTVYGRAVFDGLMSNRDAWQENIAAMYAAQGAFGGAGQAAGMAAASGGTLTEALGRIRFAAADMLKSFWDAKSGPKIALLDAPGDRLWGLADMLAPGGRLHGALAAFKGLGMAALGLVAGAAGAAAGAFRALSEAFAAGGMREAPATLLDAAAALARGFGGLLAAMSALSGSEAPGFLGGLARLMAQAASHAAMFLAGKLERLAAALALVAGALREPSEAGSGMGAAFANLGGAVAGAAGALLSLSAAAGGAALSVLKALFGEAGLGAAAFGLLGAALSAAAATARLLAGLLANAGGAAEALAGAAAFLLGVWERLMDTLRRMMPLFEGLAVVLGAALYVAARLVGAVLHGAVLPALRLLGAVAEAVAGNAALLAPVLTLVAYWAAKAALAALKWKAAIAVTAILKKLNAGYVAKQKALAALSAQMTIFAKANGLATAAMLKKNAALSAGQKSAFLLGEAKKALANKFAFLTGKVRLSAAAQAAADKALAAANKARAAAAAKAAAADKAGMALRAAYVLKLKKAAAAHAAWSAAAAKGGASSAKAKAALSKLNKAKSAAAGAGAKLAAAHGKAAAAAGGLAAANAKLAAAQKAALPVQQKHPGLLGLLKKGFLGAKAGAAALGASLKANGALKTMQAGLAGAGGAAKKLGAKLAAALGPKGLALAAAAALSAGVAALALRSREASEAAAGLRDRARGLADAARDSAAAACGESAAAMRDGREAAAALAERVAALAGSQSRSAEESDGLRRGADALNRLAPGLGLAFDAVSGSLNMSAESMKALVAAAGYMDGLDANAAARAGMLAEEEALRRGLAAAAGAEAEALAALEALSERSAGASRRRAENAVADRNALNAALRDAREAAARYSEALDANGAAQGRASDEARRMAESLQKTRDGLAAQAAGAEAAAASAAALDRALEMSARAHEGFRRASASAFEGAARDAERPLAALRRGLAEAANAAEESARRTREFPRQIAKLEEAVAGLDFADGFVRHLREMGEDAVPILESINRECQRALQEMLRNFARMESANLERHAVYLRNLCDLSREGIAAALAAAAREALSADEIGRMMVGGMSAGMRAALPELVGASAGMARAAHEAFEAALEIASPSRLFMRSGRMVAEGAAAGIAQAAGAVAGAARRMASAAGEGTLAEAARARDAYLGMAARMAESSLALWEGYHAGRLAAEAAMTDETRRAAEEEARARDGEARLFMERLDRRLEGLSMSAAQEKAYMAALLAAMSADAAARGALEERYMAARGEALRRGQALHAGILDEMNRLEEGFMRRLEDRARELARSFDMMNGLRLSETNADRNAQEAGRLADEYLRAAEAVRGVQAEIAAAEAGSEAQMRLFAREREALEAMNEARAAKVRAAEEASRTQTEIMAANLREQMGNMEEWARQMDILTERGVYGGFLEHMRAMGPEAVRYLRQLNASTCAELLELADLYRQSHELARRHAARGLEGLRADTEGEIERLAGRLAEIALGEYPAVGGALMDGIRQGVEAGQSAMIEAAVAAATEAHRRAKAALGMAGGGGGGGGAPSNAGIGSFAAGDPRNALPFSYQQLPDVRNAYSPQAGLQTGLGMAAAGAQGRGDIIIHTRSESPYEHGRIVRNMNEDMAWAH